MNTKDKGEICELEVILAFKKMGIPVLLPYGDNLRFDICVIINNIFYRIQIKKGHITKNGCINFKTCSYTYGFGSRGKGMTDYRGEIDFFAVCYENNVYLVPITEVNNPGSLRLRLDPPKHPNKTIRWAKDYQIKEQVDKIRSLSSSA